jgi:hypothetical protein
MPIHSGTAIATIARHRDEGEQGAPEHAPS